MKKIYKALKVVLTVLILIPVLLPISIVNAAALTALSNTMSTQKITTASSHTIRFTTPTGVTAAGNTIVITFPADFDFTSKTIGTITLSHGATTGAESTETLAAAADASNWGAVFSGTQNRILTLTAPTDGTGAAAFSAGQKGIITYSSANSINATSAAIYSITLVVNGDTGSISVPIISDDQVSVTATVDQTLSFTISDNTIGFGTLSSASTRYATGDTLGQGSEPSAAHTLTANTNASSGYSLAVSGATLTSGANTISSIPAGPLALSVGTEQFGIRTTASGGSGTVTSPFNGTASNYGFGTSPLAAVSFASATAATANTTYSVNYAANISALTESGSYTTALTYVVSANF